ncbi:LysE family translocator [Cognatishimia sp. WU-CL00825]|uniref:LysE family translocator n=1 Tax=Cognatishimia sp. WU-CL00825 TaxID=3127658 RepID=UPI0033658A0B
MLPFDIVVTFALATLLLSLAPGPDNVFVLTQSALHGAVSGLYVVLGLCTGLLFHSAAVALGLAAVIQASALAFTVIKFIGAAYLLYLAYQAFRAKPQSLHTKTVSRSGWALYRRGVLMNITNPKVALFFLALFPQFTDPALGNLTGQIALLSMVFVGVALLVFGSVALVAGRLSQTLMRTPKMQTVTNRVAGLVFVGLAAKIATSQR